MKVAPAIQYAVLRCKNDWPMARRCDFGHFLAGVLSMEFVCLPFNGS